MHAAATYNPFWWVKLGTTPNARKQTKTKNGLKAPRETNTPQVRMEGIRADANGGRKTKLLLHMVSDKPNLANVSATWLASLIVWQMLHSVKECINSWIFLTNWKHGWSFEQPLWIMLTAVRESELTSILPYLLSFSMLRPVRTASSSAIVIVASPMSVAYPKMKLPCSLRITPPMAALVPSPVTAASVLSFTHSWEGASHFVWRPIWWVVLRWKLLAFSRLVLTPIACA